ncbi:CAP domain-containing protein [Nocardia sp. NPDC049526]|uniref:CAP domain-containing protein n=1 Tax=Nocardia sp. NPDC049526 TaxID=3364316 RepID=UPI0037AC14E2
MSPSKHPIRRPAAALLAAIAGLTIAVLPLTEMPTAAAAPDCAHADDPVIPPDKAPTGTSGSRSRLRDLFPDLAYRHEIEKAVLCLTNAERSQRGIPALEWNMQLVDSAEKYGTEADRLNWWVGSTKQETVKWHIHPETPRTTADDNQEATVQIGKRIAAAQPCAPGKTLVHWAENTAWGTGNRSTARAIVDAWMHSDTHRANILDKDSTLLGPGAVYGLAQPGTAPDQAGLYVQHFASCK